MLEELRDGGLSSISCPTSCPNGDVVGRGELPPFDDVDMIVVVEAVLLIDRDEVDLEINGSTNIIGNLFSSSFLSISSLISSRISLCRGDSLFPGIDTAARKF